MDRQDPPPSDTVGTRIGTPETPRVYTVYRYYDKRGQLLYVGYTDARHARAHAHWRSAVWWSLIATATFRHYKTQRRALAAEARAIMLEHPTYNKQLTGRGRGWFQGSMRAFKWWRHDHPEFAYLMTPADLAEIVELQEVVVRRLIVERNLPHILLLGKPHYMRIRIVDAEIVIRGLTTGHPA